MKNGDHVLEMETGSKVIYRQDNSIRSSWKGNKNAAEKKNTKTSQRLDWS